MTFTSHITGAMQQQAAQKIERRIGHSEAYEPHETLRDQLPAEDGKPSVSPPFAPYKGKVRMPGTGGIYELNDHLFEGSYSPTNAHGKREVHTVYIYDGFYAVCTNLDDDPADIARINRDRWEIEESFRIMKTEFEARPVFLQRDGRIEAHFLTCFIALMIYRILEKQLKEEYTCDELIATLRKMNMRKIDGHGYIPCYKRTDITDALHKNAGFHTDYELLTSKTMAGIIRRSKGL